MILRKRGVCPKIRRMPSKEKRTHHLIGDRVAFAKSKTEKVQENIQLAAAEVHLANQVVTGKLANSVSDADLDKVVVHNEAVEEKLRDATEELEVVTELLHSEEQDRERLEQSLAELKAADSNAQPGTRSGEGSASVIEHLRELTRHKLNAETDERAKPQASAAKSKSRTGGGSRRLQP